MIIQIYITASEYAAAARGAAHMGLSLPRAIQTRALAAKTPPSPPAASAAHPSAPAAHPSASAAPPSASAPAEIPTPVTSTEELYNLSK